MKIGVFVQARLHSSRLPYKMLLPFPGGSLIQHVLRAARKIDASVYAFLVPQNDMTYFEYYAKKEGFDLLGGSEEDVYGRFIGALNHYKDLEFIVRVTGDKVLLSPIYTQRALDFMISQYYNIYAHLNWVYFANPPLNQVTGDALFVPKLRELYKPDIPDTWREHIITAFQANSLGCEVPEPIIPPSVMKYSRLVVDTEDDYRKLLEIYRCFYKGEVIELDTILDAFNAFGY
jgi:spore coat polysaccharide biosynthesis protein SpsF (cytidylyltransferase family)